MPSEKSLAIVLRVIEFSETSIIATLFTREFGKISALAKGARRPKSPFEAALDLCALCRIVFLAKSSDSLDLLTEARLERRFRAAQRDLARLYAGFYVVELLNELTDKGDPHPDLFDLADATLLSLDEDGDVAALVLRFELVALRWLGHLPSLDACSQCGTPIEPNGRISLAPTAGGVLCPNCRPGQRQVVSLSPAAWNTLRVFAAATTSELPELAAGTKGEVRGVLNHYLAHHLGHRPRLHDFLGMLVR